MKTSKEPRLVGVAVLLLCVAVSSTAAGYNTYVSTELNDPLQPVWDNLDRLPQELSDAVIRAVRTQFTRLSTQLENKVRPLNNAMTGVTASINRLEQSVSSRGPTNDTARSLAGLYQTQFVRDLEESVTKIERHVNTRLDALETKLKQHIDTKFASLAATGEADSEGERESQAHQTNTQLLENINTHVLKINEKLSGSSEGGESCGTLIDKVSELMAECGGGGCACPSESQSRNLPLGLPRDCSDKHWQTPETPSGVYETFPTLDPKDPVSAFCDMGQLSAKDTGGWTVILRRRNSTYGLVDFNRTWAEYRMGFGEPGEGEWWFGLAPLHALTYRQPFEVDLLLHDIERGTFHAQYTTFRVEDEAHNYRLILSGFTGNLTHDALTSKHHGSPFTTRDRDNDAWGSGNCGQSNSGGWWFNNCHLTTLTAPFPTSTNRNAKTIRWHDDVWLVLDDVTMKIRPFNYAQRFNPHTMD